MRPAPTNESDFFLVTGGCQNVVLPCIFWRFLRLSYSHRCRCRISIGTAVVIRPICPLSYILKYLSARYTLHVKRAHFLTCSFYHVQKSIGFLSLYRFITLSIYHLIVLSFYHFFTWKIPRLVLLLLLIVLLSFIIGLLSSRIVLLLFSTTTGILFLHFFTCKTRVQPPSKNDHF